MGIRANLGKQPSLVKSDHDTLRFAVARNRGGRRCRVACSNEYASLIRVGSLQARPKNEIPTGKPERNPAVTLMLGYPATAAAFELPPATWSPLTRSVSHAGPPVGATIASRWYLSMSESMPSVRAS